MGRRYGRALLGSRENAALQHVGRWQPPRSNPGPLTAPLQDVLLRACCEGRGTPTPPHPGAGRLSALLFNCLAGTEILPPRSLEALEGEQPLTPLGLPFPHLSNQGCAIDPLPRRLSGGSSEHTDVRDAGWWLPAVGPPPCPGCPPGSPLGGSNRGTAGVMFGKAEEPLGPFQ